MSLKVYGIPNCGTCKKALFWLEQHNIKYTFINTKQHPPTEDTIAQWVAALTAKPMRNTSGGAYRAIGEEKKAWSDTDWTVAFAKDAMLLRRPLFEKDGEAIMVGFRASEDEKIAKLSS